MSHLSATKPRSSNIIPVEQQCFHSINISLLHFVPIKSSLGRGKILEGDTVGKIVPNWPRKYSVLYNVMLSNEKKKNNNGGMVVYFFLSLNFLETDCALICWLGVGECLCITWLVGFVWVYSLLCIVGGFEVFYFLFLSAVSPSLSWPIIFFKILLFWSFLYPTGSSGDRNEENSGWCLIADWG